MEPPRLHPCTPSGPLEIHDGIHIHNGEQAMGIEPGDASLDSATGSDSGSGLLRPSVRGSRSISVWRATAMVAAF
jgi:hypothetical protein